MVPLIFHSYHNVQKFFSHHQQLRKDPEQNYISSINDNNYSFHVFFTMQKIKEKCDILSVNKKKSITKKTEPAWMHFASVCVTSRIIINDCINFLLTFVHIVQLLWVCDFLILSYSYTDVHIFLQCHLHSDFLGFLLLANTG